jgi:hypothetical protein
MMSGTQLQMKKKSTRKENKDNKKEQWKEQASYERIQKK